MGDMHTCIRGRAAVAAAVANESSCVRAPCVLMRANAVQAGGRGVDRLPSCNDSEGKGGKQKPPLCPGPGVWANSKKQAAGGSSSRSSSSRKLAVQDRGSTPKPCPLVSGPQPTKGRGCCPIRGQTPGGGRKGSDPSHPRGGYLSLGVGDGRLTAVSKSSKGNDAGAGSNVNEAVG